MRYTRALMILMAALLAGCGNPRLKAIAMFKTNPTLYVQIYPVSLASAAGAQFLSPTNNLAQVCFTPVYITEYVYRGMVVRVFEHESELPPRSTFQLLDVEQLMMVLTNFPAASGIMFHDIIINTNDLTAIKPDLAARQPEELRIIHTR